MDSPTPIQKTQKRLTEKIMPNWVFNKLVIENATPAFYDYLNNNGFSFRKIIPCEEDIHAQEAAWGTKWDLEESNEVAQELMDDDVADFATAGDAPYNVIEALTLQFPTIKFALHYYGNFFGGTIFATGGLAIDESLSDDEDIKDHALNIFGITNEEEDDEDELPLIPDYITPCLSCQENNLFDVEDE